MDELIFVCLCFEKMSFNVRANTLPKEIGIKFNWKELRFLLSWDLTRPKTSFELTYESLSILNYFEKYKKIKFQKKKKYDFAIIFNHLEPLLRCQLFRKNKIIFFQLEKLIKQLNKIVVNPHSYTVQYFFCNMTHSYVRRRY